MSRSLTNYIAKTLFPNKVTFEVLGEPKFFVGHYLLWIEFCPPQIYMVKF